MLNRDWTKSSRSTANGNCVEARWAISSRCNGGDCVEVGACDCVGVHVRDSKDPDGPVLSFTRAEWRAFIDGVKLGEFDAGY